MSELFKTEEERELLEEYALFKSINKGKSEDYLKFKRFKDYKENNKILKKNGKETLTYDQWYHTIKEKEWNDIVVRTEQKANKQLIDNINREKNEFQKLQMEIMGKFHFNIYEKILALNLEGQYLIRFVYLCCFLDFNDKKVKWGKSNNKYATVKDLEEIWGLKEEECRKTKNALIEKELIIINEDKTISINKKYAFKGNAKKDMKGSVKMFEDGFKEIYENATPKEHKRLGILIKLLPLVNYDWNILCYNAEETEEDKIIPLTLKDICLIVGYNENQSSRLKKELLKIKVDGKAVICIHNIEDKNVISINPMIYYKGHNIEKLKYLFALFKIADK